MTRRDQDTSIPSAADAQLFRDAIGPVRPLPVVDASPRKPPPPALPRMREADERAALDQSRRGDALEDQAAGDVLSYRRDEVSPQVLRRLRRGEFVIEDELDLHHLGERAAETLLRRFLVDARLQAAPSHSAHCLRIVHGKGLHSINEPVLKHMLARVLIQRADILAFASAPPALGGTGAALVLLNTATHGRK
ncbi:MAG: Smr/MutS family protein [Lysobacteraceae bacterium]